MCIDWDLTLCQITIKYPVVLCYLTITCLNLFLIHKCAVVAAVLSMSHLSLYTSYPALSSWWHNNLQRSNKSNHWSVSDFTVQSVYVLIAMLAVKSTIYRGLVLASFSVTGENPRMLRTWQGTFCKVHGKKSIPILTRLHWQKGHWD